MSNFKCIFLLLVAIVALAAANVYVGLVDRGTVAVRRQTLCDAAAEVSGVVIRRGGRVETELSRTNGHWRLVAPYAGSADEQVVLRLLDALSLPSVQEVMSDAELVKLGRSRGDFSLDVPPVELTVSAAGGARTVVSFGERTPGADGVYAAVSGEEGVFIVATNVLAAVNLPTESFRRRSLVLAGEGVLSFDIRGKARTSIPFVKGESGGWTVSGERASAEKIEKFLGELFSAEARRFVWPVGATNETARASASLLAGYGLDPDSAVTVSLTGGDKTVNQISFGKEADAGLVYALIQNGAAIAMVPAALKDVVDRASDAFTDSRLFPLDARSVNTYSIVSGSVLYAFSREATGQWRIESPIAAPADRVAAEAVLSRILALTSADVLTNGGVQVSVMTNAAKETVSGGSVLGGLTFEAFRSKTMLRVDPVLVTRIVRHVGAAADKADSVVYVRDRRAWNVEKAASGATADAKGIASVLSAVAQLQAVRVEKLKVPAANLAEFGLDVPRFTIAIDQSSEDSVRRNILIGRRTKGGSFATVGSSDAVFVIADDQVRKLAAPIVTGGTP